MLHNDRRQPIGKYFCTGHGGYSPTSDLWSQ
jgi:hypothetical protein